jgi:hypothetical protein
MKDYLVVGSSPIEEECVQVGTNDYERKSRIECNHFIKALKKKFGEPPVNTSLEIKRFPHDFGTYHEVVCYFETTDIESGEYACMCESGTPMTWAEVGMEAPKF